MNLFIKEVECMYLIAEDADARFIADLFLEEAASEGSSEGIIPKFFRKAKETVAKLIKSFVDFIKGIKTKITSMGVKAKLKAAAAIKGVKVKFRKRDREITENMNRMDKAIEKSIKDINSIEKLLAEHKITIDEANERLRNIEEAAENIVNAIAEGLESIDEDAIKEFVEVCEVARYGMTIEELQEKKLMAYDKVIEAELNDIRSDIEALNRKIDSCENPAEVNSLKAECALKTKKASFLGRLGKKVVKGVVEVCGVAAITGICAYYVDKQNSRSRTNNFDVFDDGL